MREFDECNHSSSVLLLLDCKAGGRQYRRYCLTCWQDLEGAIAHARAHQELHGDPPVLGDIEQLHKARNCYLQRLWEAQREVAGW